MAGGPLPLATQQGYSFYGNPMERSLGRIVTAACPGHQAQLPQTDSILGPSQDGQCLDNLLAPSKQSLP